MISRCYITSSTYVYLSPYSHRSPGKIAILWPLPHPRINGFIEDFPARKCSFLIVFGLICNQNPPRKNTVYGKFSLLLFITVTFMADHTLICIFLILWE